MSFLIPLLLIAQALTIETVLPPVQGNVDAFVKSLPDFVCTERVFSTTTKNGKLEHELRMESQFRGRQVRRVGFSFVESRVPVTIDGRPALKGEKPSAGDTFAGGFSSVLDASFSSEYARFQTYRLAGKEMVDGREMLVIEFATLPDETALAFGWEGKRIVTKDRGKGWIDPATMRVLRVERTYSGLPAKAVLTFTVDYAPVQIGGKEYLMPKTVRAVMDRKSEHVVYVAEYSGYKKFEVTSGIVN